ncbi:MAG: hypothetical protein WCM76_14495 [Bacteroidota bacterium]
MIRKNARLILLFLLAVCAQSISAQDSYFLMGRVVNITTGKGIPYINVGLMHHPIGTMSNARGDFEFTFPASAYNDTLLVSSLGFMSYRVMLKDLDLNTKVYVPLNPTIYQMKPVIITPREVSKGYDIVKQAIENLPKNLSQQTFMSDGYYREYIKENNSYARAIEAAVSVYCDGQIHVGDYFYPVRIDGIRSSQDYLSRFAKTESYNQLSLFLTGNMDIQWFLMGQDNLEFTMDSMVMLDDNLVYVVSAIPEGAKMKKFVRYSYTVDHYTNKIVRKKVKSEYLVDRNTNSFFKYTYYIRSDNYAFVKVAYEDTAYFPELRTDTKANGLYISFNSVKRTLDFTEYENKWYPKYIRENKEIGYYKKKDSALFLTVSKYSDLMVNKIENQGVKVIPDWEQVRLYEDIFHQGYDYDADFWKKYNLIPDDELRMAVTRDIGIAQSEHKDFTYEEKSVVYDTVDEAVTNKTLEVKKDTSKLIAQNSVKDKQPKDNTNQTKDNSAQTKDSNTKTKDNSTQTKDNSTQTKDNSTQTKDNSTQTKDNNTQVKDNSQKQVIPADTNKYAANPDAHTNNQNQNLNADNNSGNHEKGVADLYFRVQILVSKSILKTDNSLFKGLNDVRYYLHNGLYKYTYGNEKSMEDALEIQTELRNLGFDGAFIVPFYKGNRITVDDALQILSNSK